MAKQTEKMDVAKIAANMVMKWPTKQVCYCIFIVNCILFSFQAVKLPFPPYCSSNILSYIMPLM